MTGGTTGDRRGGTVLGEVVILDEHPIWLDALETILSDNRVSVVGKATSPEMALDLVCSKKPDALIAPLELASLGMDALEALRTGP